MGSNEDRSFYDELRQKNFQEKQEMMRKLGFKVPEAESVRKESTLPVLAKRGRQRRSLPSDTSDEDFQNNVSDSEDEDCGNATPKKRRKREKKAPQEKEPPVWNNSSMAIKTTVSNRNKRDRYPKRYANRPKNEDDYTPGSDDMLYCADCKREWEGDCPEHGPLLVVEDIQVPANINDKSRATKTAPSIITVADSKIPEAGSGVWARNFIPARVRFGPYDGKRVSHDVRNPYTWLIRKNGKPHYCVDATEPGLSNWMRFVNCARYDGEQNLEAFQYCGNIYYRTLRRIAPHEELLVWYGDDYGRQLGIDPEICDEQDEEKWREMRFKCPGCEFSYISPMYLERHKKLCRQLKSVETSGQKFQCEGCKLLYSDAEYLRRHMRFCRKLHYTTSGITKTLGTQGIKSGTEGPTEKSGIKAETEGSTEKSSIRNTDEDHDLQGEDEQTVCPNRETEKRQSLPSNVESEVNQIPPKTAKKCQNHSEIAVVLQPETTTVNQSKLPKSYKRKRSTSIQSRTVTSPEIPAEDNNDIDRVRETPANINSEISNKIQPGSAAEIMSNGTTNVIDERTEIEKIQEAYIRLDRIPWFSDRRAAEKPHLCTDCNERFSEKHELDSHILEHRMETLFVCPVRKCNKTFSQERRLWEHVEVHFTEEPVVSSKVPSRKPSVSKPVRVPGALKFYVCPKCHKFFSERENLRDHSCVEIASERAPSECSSEETFIEEKCHTCLECEESFDSLQHLTLHQVSHRAGNRLASELSDLKPWSKDLQSCLVNGETALFPERMREFSVTHTLTTSVTVQFGDELFSTESSVQLRNESGVKENRASTSVQKKSERSNTQLAISGSLKNYLNAPKGVFVCSKCNSKFAQKSSLILHRRAHRVEKHCVCRFICRLCKKGFSYNGSFQRHIQAHLSEP